MYWIHKKWNLLMFYSLTIVLFLLGTVLGNKAVTVIVENTPIVRKHTIVIDAGHGGEDGGAVSCSGRNESQINLEIALRLEDLLHFLGYDTRMIRKTDIAVYTKGESIAQKKVSDLKQRVKTVNSISNAILVSVHQNSFPDSRYSGAQVFCASTAGSDVLAETIQETFRKTVNAGSQRQIKKASGIYLMEKITVPGVLVECGFLSNRVEEQKLSDSEYQKKICCILSASLSSFLHNS